MGNQRTTLTATAAAAALCLSLGASVFAGQDQVSKRRSTLTMGLIHRWQFDGNANDSMGNLSSIPVGPVAYTDVGYGQGIVFNGSSTGISLPPVEDMQFKASFSISVWAKLDARPPSSNMWSAIIFDGDDRAGYDSFALQADPGGKLHFLVTGEPDHLGEIEAPFPLHTYVFVTATYDKAAGVENLYADGKLVAQSVGHKDLTPVCHLVDRENAGIGIGTGNSFQNSRYHFGWKGVLSDLRIYNRAITPDEVAELFHLGVTHTKTRVNPVINP